MPGCPKDLCINGKTICAKVEKCGECPYTSRHICDLRTHAQMYIGKREFACGQCTYSTKRSHVLNAHLQLHMAEKEDITAISNIARKEDGFRNHSILRHGKIVEERSDHQLFCRWCPYRTRICATLFVHHRNHLRNSRLRCGNCTFSTSIETKLRDHVKFYPPIEPLSNASLIKHTASKKHAKLPNGDYSCQECSFTCNGYGKFWHHKQKHRKASRYQCDLCSYSVASNFCLMKHRQSHTNHDSPKSCGTKMEELIVIKDYYSEEISTHGITAVEGVVKKKKCIVNSKNELWLNCTKDAKIYQFNLSRIASKLPNFKAMNDTELVSMIFRYKHCPYYGTDEVLFKYHEEMHVGHRQYSCNICTYSSFCPISLHWHLNLHFPSLPSRSTAKNRKRLIRHRYHQNPETIPSDVKVHQCSICPYKTAYEDRLQQHRLYHALVGFAILELHIQQRLITSIKRAGQNISEPFMRPKIRRPEKHLDGQVGGLDSTLSFRNNSTSIRFTCSKCSFRCGTIIAYNTHSEKHGAESFFKCELCDYSSGTKNAVDFHIAMHHLDVPISFFYKKAVTNSDESQIKLNSDIDHRKYPQQILSCCRCDYRTFMIIEFIHHWEQMHCSRTQKDGRQIAEELRMDMMHSNWIRTVDN